MSARLLLRLFTIMILMAMFFASCAFGIAGDHVAENSVNEAFAINNGVHHSIHNEVQSSSSFQYSEETLVLLNGTIIQGNFANTNSTIRPWAIAYDRSNDYVYVANSGLNDVYVINSSNSIIAKKYSVEFNESGLPSGYAWNLTFNGSVHKLDNSSYVFSVQNGSYNYSASSKGYREISGSVNVNGSNRYVNISFVPEIYSVSFTESGLPAGTEWYVNVTNMSTGYVFHGRSNLSDMPFFLSNGSYAYTVAAVDKNYAPSPSSGSLSVNGTNSSIVLVFKELRYSVIFSETGLQSGVSWSVTFDGITDSSTSSSITFIVPNGTYSYVIGSVAGYTQPSNGTVRVNGSTVIQSVAFTRLFSVPPPELHPKSHSLDEELYIITGVLIVAIIALAVYIVKRKK